MYQLLAVCPMGLEAVVAKEIQELGYDTTVENGRIFLKATKLPLLNVIYGYAQQIESKLLLANLKPQPLMNYLKKQRHYLGKRSLNKMVISQYKVEVLNLHYLVYLIAKPS